VASCDELGAIPKSKLTRRIGRLSEAKLLELADALTFSLQLD
jgi:mRNA-degrading endonuclease toxin of MazEF toxin-antitoxin module